MELKRVAFMTTTFLACFILLSTARSSVGELGSDCDHRGDISDSKNSNGDEDEKLVSIAIFLQIALLLISLFIGYVFEP